MRCRLFVLALLIAAATAPASVALAWAEGGVVGVFTGEDTCEACHMAPWGPFPTRQGPHGGYSTATDRCSVCHTLHAAPSGSIKLLPGTTVKSSCQFCHDGSGGHGVYGTLAARGVSVGASHSIDATSIVPGGNGETGSSAEVAFGGEGDHLSCDDCHSPHDANTVEPYSGERVRFHSNDRLYGTEWATSHLLRKRPTGSDVTATVYGSDWCAGCHKGRRSGIGMPSNHPVDSLATTETPFYYNRVALVSSDTSFETTYGTMGLLGWPPGIWHNRGFVMPYPRTSQQEGHAPICMQCHQNARDVGEVGSVNPAHIYRYGDGTTAHNASHGDPPDVPLFQTFPHEGQNTNFLIETGDDLCTNCHPVSMLP